MKVLALINRILETLGLCLKDFDHPNYGRITNYSIVLSLTGMLMITIEFISTHFDNAGDTLYAIMQLVTFVTVSICYICFANQKHLTFEVIMNLQEIVDNYSKYFWRIKFKLYSALFPFRATEKKHGKYGLYEEAERKSYGIAKWPLIIFFVNFYGVIILSVIDIIITDVLPGELHPGEWYTFYKMTWV